MAAEKNIKQFSALDIEKYHKGLLSEKERHNLEKAALDDPFLADALEGYAAAGVNVAGDLAELKQRLADRTANTLSPSLKAKQSIVSPWLRVAAMLFILAGAGLLVYQLAFNKKNTEVAQVIKDDASKEEKNNTIPEETTPEVQNSDNRTNDGEINKVIDNKASGKENKTATAKTTTTEINNDAKKINPTDIVKENKESIAVTSGPPALPTEATGVPTEKSTAAKDETGENRQVEKTTVAKKQESLKEKPVSNNYHQPAGVVNNPDVATANQQGFYNRNRNYKTFHGRVTDAANRGLPFANVTNMNDQVGTYTDAQGYFTLTSPDSVLLVQIRSIGYDNMQVQLRNDVASNKIVMREDRQNIAEVVISKQKPNSIARSGNVNRTLLEPEPKDGWEKYDSYLANNLNIPDDYTQKANTGNTVEVSFEVDKNGEPVNFRVEKSLCPSCDKEAIRLIKEGPKWKRNTHKKGRTTVTINF